jgi:hypothetical protein
VRNQRGIHFPEFGEINHNERDFILIQILGNVGSRDKRRPNAGMEIALRTADANRKGLIPGRILELSQYWIKFDAAGDYGFMDV